MIQELNHVPYATLNFGVFEKIQSFLTMDPEIRTQRIQELERFLALAPLCPLFRDSLAQNSDSDSDSEYSFVDRLDAILEGVSCYASLMPDFMFPGGAAQRAFAVFFAQEEIGKIENPEELKQAAEKYLNENPNVQDKEGFRKMIRDVAQKISISQKMEDEIEQVD